MARLSLNTATLRGTDLIAMADACAAAGIGWIAPWREQLQVVPVATAARAIRAAGLRVSSLCRGGFFPAPSSTERAHRLDDNRRAIDEAAELGTDVLVMVCGGVVGKDLEGSRQMVEDGLEALLPYAAERGVTLGIEPLHPLFAADRSVIVTLGQANALARRLAADWAASPGRGTAPIGVVVDVYHVWWDPEVESQIDAAGAAIFGFHVNDWIVPLPDMLAGRGMMGDGFIDLRRLRTRVDEAGYGGPIEVEIFNEALWRLPTAEVLHLLRDRFRETVM